MPTLNINIPDADATTKGIAELATQTEVNTGTDTTRIVTPDTLEDKTYGTFTGSTITDNATLKTALQELETAVEGAGGTEYLVDYFSLGSNTISDATTYTMGKNATTLGTNQNQAYNVQLPTCTVTAAYITTYCGSAVGSNEAITFNLRHSGGGSTDLISNSITWDANRNKGFSVTGLNISVTAGLSYVEIVTPTMVTNPTGARVIVMLVIEI